MNKLATLHQILVGENTIHRKKKSAPNKGTDVLVMHVAKNSKNVVYPNHCGEKVFDG